MVELFHRLDKTEVALLNKVKKLHSAADIALCNAYHKAKVRFGKALSCLCGVHRVVAVHSFGKADFLIGGKQRNAADFLKINLYRVVDAYSLDYGAVLVYFVLFNVGKVKINIRRRSEILHNLYAVAFKHIVKLVHLSHVKIHFINEIGNFLCGQLSACFAVFNKLCKTVFLFCHLKFPLNLCFAFGLCCFYKYYHAPERGAVMQIWRRFPKGAPQGSV